METTTEINNTSAAATEVAAKKEYQRVRPLNTEGKSVSPRRLEVIREDHIVGRGTGSPIDEHFTDDELLDTLDRADARSYSDALRWARGCHKAILAARKKNAAAAA